VGAFDKPFQRLKPTVKHLCEMNAAFKGDL